MVIIKSLEFKNVSKSFCHNEEIVDVLDDVSFTVDEGQVVCIVGPSGAGKSTILNLISQLLKPTSGVVEVNGGIGYMFQRDCLFDWKTIYNNVLLGLEIKHIKTKENIARVERMLKEYGLENFKSSHPYELSGGMRQRVALIRTLAVNPSILLLDEPFAALDYQTKLKVSNDIYKIIKKEKKTTIMVTHDISEAISLADKIIILSNRPAKVKEIIDINIEEDNPIKKRQNGKFQEYFEKIWDVINYE
ncbi:MAG: ABC transporter ATP-binding protein [Bacilli bacterium]|nr:ABC transporter ATP-binding protein [Acholeplasmataceae bacterium]MDY2902974.1 ABC transporter ATP-binding protein [Bacilli bacterium]